MLGVQLVAARGQYRTGAGANGLFGGPVRQPATSAGWRHDEFRGWSVASALDPSFGRCPLRRSRHDHLGRLR
jgi:hypothetical protein